MADTTISVRIDEQLYAKMKQLETINWSAVMRRAVQQQVEQQQKREAFDTEKALRAVESMEKIRKSRIFDGGKSSVEIIREWRNKRRF
jgi:predicted transcriptional regulator